MNRLHLHLLYFQEDTATDFQKSGSTLKTFHVWINYSHAFNVPLRYYYFTAKMLKKATIWRTLSNSILLKLSKKERAYNDTKWMAVFYGVRRPNQ